MILTKNMEVNPVLAIKTTISWHMEAQRKNGPRVAKLILKHITCKSKVIGAWKVSAISYLLQLMQPVYTSNYKVSYNMFLL